MPSQQRSRFPHCPNLGLGDRTIEQDPGRPDRIPHQQPAHLFPAIDGSSRHLLQPAVVDAPLLDDIQDVGD